MIKLYIRDKGFLINIPGLAPFRTPAEVDVSLGDVKRVEVELRKMGINNFVIKYENDEQIKKTKVKGKSIVKKIVEKIVGPTIIKETIDVDQLHKRFDNIDKILSEIVRRPNELHNLIEYKKPEKEKVEEDGFIPTIDTSDIKLGGPTEYSRVEDAKEKDLERKSKNLSKISDNKGFKKSYVGELSEIS